MSGIALFAGGLLLLNYHTNFVLCVVSRSENVCSTLPACPRTIERIVTAKTLGGWISELIRRSSESFLISHAAKSQHDSPVRNFASQLGHLLGAAKKF
ncbi:hypothetical protein BDR03DRAFT_202332 [Suillus americanus]|nr:hypothetical protein BDR03DRAFT_202332 [Suillus americanus]